MIIMVAIIHNDDDDDDDDVRDKEIMIPVTIWFPVAG